MIQAQNIFVFSSPWRRLIDVLLYRALPIMVAPPYISERTIFGAVLLFVHSLAHREMASFQSLIDEYAASLENLTGNDFQAEVCARLHTFIIGFQTVPAKPHGDAGLDAFSGH